MPAHQVRYGVQESGEPVVHELTPMRYGGGEVPIRLAIRRAEDGTWRGRLIFGSGDVSTAPATAEIFCAVSEADLWQAVRDLRDHHLRSLYRSLSE